MQDSNASRPGPYASASPVLHTVAGLHPDAGGPSRTVTALVDHLAAGGDLDVVLLTQALAGQPIIALPEASRARLVVARSRHAGLLACGWPARQRLAATVARHAPRIIHDHGLWLGANHFSARAARRLGIPLAIHPRGMVEPWSLRHRGWKKRLALWAYQRANLEAARVFFATAESEALTLRRLGLRQPIAVIPNGVTLPVLASAEAPQAATRKPGYRIVFLGRIHPIKGLLNLLKAWARVARPGWRIVLAGPDEVGHLGEVQARARHLGLSDCVEYAGAVEGAAKQKLLAGADLFVLPSFSENFGVVVAEALSHGVPVITTHGTPWQALRCRGCGWWVAPTVDGLADALDEASGLDDAARREMGERGRSYARTFDWSIIARQTESVYRWIWGEAPRPDCVLTD